MAEGSVAVRLLEPTQAATGRGASRGSGREAPRAGTGDAAAPRSPWSRLCPRRGSRRRRAPGLPPPPRGGPRSDSPWAWRSERAAAGWPPGGKALSNPRVSVRPAAASRRQQLRPRAPRGGAAALSAGPGGAARSQRSPERSGRRAERSGGARTAPTCGMGEVSGEFRRRVGGDLARTWV